MSAISAVINRSGNPPTADLLRAMQDAQADFGPDREAVWTDRHVGLGVRTMALLPEDQFDCQPLWTPDRSACLVFEGRLDNRDDLVRDLGLTDPAHLADSAILLAAWQRWGHDCLHQLVGGFAFAIWCPSTEELFAARDHSGERPLFYHAGDGLFALATTAHGILALPGVWGGFDEGRLVDSLTLSQKDWTRSFFAGIKRLPLGHCLRLTPNGVTTRQYWHPSDVRKARFRREQDVLDGLLDVFDKAVAARLRTVGGIGSQLSAGLDSSSVTASAARSLASRGQGLSAYTSVPRPGFLGKGLPNRLLDEAPGAAAVAALYPNVQHHVLHSAGMELMPTLQRWTAAMDEPQQNAANILWLSAIYQQARARGERVLLQATMGNATISFESGYALASLFRRGRWLHLARTAHHLRRMGDMSFKASAQFATSGLMPLWMRRRLTPAMGDVRLDHSPIHPALVSRLDLMRAEFHRLYHDAGSVAADRKMLYEIFDLGPFNAAVGAMYGLDPRDPAADRRVYEFCFSLPDDQLVYDRNSRSLVRRAMKDRLPQQTIQRYKRGQQGADWYLTIAEALPSFRRELTEIRRSPTAREMLDLDRIEHLLDTWPTEGYETAPVTYQWNYALSRGILTGYFLRSNEQRYGRASSPA